MALKNVGSRQEEFDALKDLIDPAELAAQLAGGDPPPADPPPADPPKPGTPPADPPPVDPPKPGAAGTPPDATGMLKEIFGDQFTSVDDLKNKNIPNVLKEYDQLRQQVEALSAEKEELTGKLNLKPKTAFANDDLALFNEFVKTTGIKSYDVFNRLNGVDPANMQYMDAIILSRLLENPELAAKETQLRKHVEKTYNVDPEQVSEDDLEVNQIGLAQEGAKARATLQELKGKLKVPEPEPETPSGPPKWTPEQETQAKTTWGNANKAMAEKLSTIPYYLPNSKEPIINFTVPQESISAIQEEAVQFALSNRMEATQENLETIARFMYSELKLRNEALANHAIFEKARSLTKEEALKFYHNPTPLGGDQPPAGGGDIDEAEAARQAIFDKEMGRI